MGAQWKVPNSDSGRFEWNQSTADAATSSPSKAAIYQTAQHSEEQLSKQDEVSSEIVEEERTQQATFLSGEDSTVHGSLPQTAAAPPATKRGHFEVESNSEEAPGSYYAGDWHTCNI